MSKRFLHSLIFLTGLVLLFPFSGFAETPVPVIHEPEGEGIKCVKPEEEMKRNHMNYILHQRDKTVHEGIRTETYSLAKCIDCHVEPDENGEIASHKSDEHFCNACHNYAAVTIDCFECHADRPQKYIKRASDTNADASQTIQQQLKTTLEDRNPQGGNL
jgi:hypothetical protein